MYICPICGLVTKTLHGLMGRHANKHVTQEYPITLYKRDVLIHNGRPPKVCPICHEETHIPKGESEYPQFHRKCYNKYIAGTYNPNYKGGPLTILCAYCDTPFNRYQSQLIGNNNFCSTSCAMKFYAIASNRTEKQLISDQENRRRLPIISNSDKCRNARANAIAKLQRQHKSKIESDFLAVLRGFYGEVIDQYIIDGYTFDAFVPRIRELFEVHGNYWHSSLKSHLTHDKKIKVAEQHGYRVNTIWCDELNMLPTNNWIWHSKIPISEIVVIHDGYTLDVAKIRQLRHDGTRVHVIYTNTQPDFRYAHLAGGFECIDYYYERYNISK